MITAIVLAAGRSQRMGQPKMILPWEETTVVGQVVQTLRLAGLEDILAVTGGAQDLVQQALQDMPVRLVCNPDYADGEMLHSLQAGLSAVGEDSVAALVALGDQPQMEVEVVRAVQREYASSRAPLVVPSYRMRRGHPWILDRSLWPEVFGLRSPTTLRDLLSTYHDRIHYVLVDTPTVIQDLDTPEDYRHYQPDKFENS